MLRRRISEKGGFTLLEVLIAVMVVSVGMVALAGMQAMAIQGNLHSRNLSVGVQMAEEMIERIRLNAGQQPQDYSGLNTGTGCLGADPALGDCLQWQARLQDSGLPNAVGTVTVATHPAPLDPSATVHITVTWGDLSTRSVTLTTLLQTWLT